MTAIAERPTAVPTHTTASISAALEKVVIGGDLKALSPAEKLSYYSEICRACGLNPATRPFEYLSLSGKLVLYARKDATEQLRKLNGVSITKLETSRLEDVFVVTAYAKDAAGREDCATGAVAIGSKRGDELANAAMKAETKAKRRVTLSICGLGLLDETEIPTIADARPVRVNMETGEVLDESKPAKPITDVADALDALGKIRKEVGDLMGRLAGHVGVPRDAKGKFDAAAYKEHVRFQATQALGGRERPVSMEDWEDLRSHLQAQINAMLEAEAKAAAEKKGSDDFPDLA